MGAHIATACQVALEESERLLRQQLILPPYCAMLQLEVVGAKDLTRTAGFRARLQ